MALAGVAEIEAKIAEHDSAKLATRPIVEDALVAESRDYYEHGVSAGQVWRDGVCMGRLKTAEGFVDTGRPASANGTR